MSKLTDIQAFISGNPDSPTGKEDVDAIPLVERPAYTYVKPTMHRMVVTKPQEAGRRVGERRTRGGLILPRSIRQREGAIVCEVVSVGETVTQFVPGELVLLAEFSGIALLDDLSNADNAWIVSQDEVIARVDPAYWQEFGDDESGAA